MGENWIGSVVVNGHAVWANSMGKWGQGGAGHSVSHTPRLGGAGGGTYAILPPVENIIVEDDPVLMPFGFPFEDSKILPPEEQAFAELLGDAYTQD